MMTYLISLEKQLLDIIQDVCYAESLASQISAVWDDLPSQRKLWLENLLSHGQYFIIFAGGSMYHADSVLS